MGVYIKGFKPQDGLYVIKDGVIRKYKAKGGTVRPYELVEVKEPHDEGYKQGRYDEKVETETSLQNGEQTHALRTDTHAVRSDTISRAAAIDAIADQNEMHPKDRIIAIEVLGGLQSAQPETCEGCKHLGKWENEVEYGYPSPCTSCKRRVEDHYER